MKGIKRFSVVGPASLLGIGEVDTIDKLTDWASAIVAAIPEECRDTAIVGLECCPDNSWRFKIDYFVEFK